MYLGQCTTIDGKQVWWFLDKTGRPRGQYINQTMLRDDSDSDLSKCPTELANQERMSHLARPGRAVCPETSNTKTDMKAVHEDCSIYLHCPDLRAFTVIIFVLSTARSKVTFTQSINCVFVLEWTLMGGSNYRWCSFNTVKQITFIGLLSRKQLQ